MTLEGMPNEDELAVALVAAARELGQCRVERAGVRCGGVARHESPCQFGIPRITVKAAWRDGGKAVSTLEEGADIGTAAGEALAFLMRGAITVTIERGDVP